jgi:hypothetical protein
MPQVTSALLLDKLAVCGCAIKASPNGPHSSWTRTGSSVSSTPKISMSCPAIRILSRHWTRSSLNSLT